MSFSAPSLTFQIAEMSCLAAVRGLGHGRNMTNQRRFYSADFYKKIKVWILAWAHQNIHVLGYKYSSLTKGPLHSFYSATFKVERVHLAFCFAKAYRRQTFFQGE